MKDRPSILCKGDYKLNTVPFSSPLGNTSPPFGSVQSYSTILSSLSNTTLDLRGNDRVIKSKKIACLINNGISQHLCQCHIFHISKSNSIDDVKLSPYTH